MNKHDKIISSVKASMAIEGLEPSDYAISLIEQYSEGKITVKEYISEIREKYKISKQTK